MTINTYSPEACPEACSDGNLQTLVDIMALNAKQQRFVEEYLVDLNATQAAIRAGYSKRTAEQQGSRLLSNVKVAKAVSKAQEALSERAGITQERVLKRFEQIAFADPNALSSLRVGACRHCHGHGHSYQWRLSLIHILRCRRTKKWIFM